VLQPIDELFDQRVDAGAAGVEPDVRLFVCRAALMIQAFEAGAIGRKRPAPVGGHSFHQPIQRHVEPHRHAVAVDRRAVLNVGEGAAASRHHEVPRASLLDQNLAFDRPEITFAVTGENVADRVTIVKD